MPLESPQEQMRRYILALEARIQALEGQVSTLGDDMAVPVGRALVAEASGISGNVFVDGIKIAATAWNTDSSKIYLRVDFGTDPPTLTEESGPSPSSWGNNIAWRQKPRGGSWCIFDRIG